MSDISPVSVPSEPPPAESADFEPAFDAMVREHYARLGVFAYRLTGSRGVAEDVVHEVLLRIWRGRIMLPPAEMLPYLYRAVRNETTSWRRRQARGIVLVTDGDAMMDRVCDHTADQAVAVELSDLQRAVEAGVEMLPERCRDVFRMHREQGLSYREIAALLGLSLKTVENHMGRALKMIRRQVAPFLSVALMLASR